MEPDRSAGKEDSGRQGQGRGLVLEDPHLLASLCLLAMQEVEGSPARGPRVLMPDGHLVPKEKFSGWLDFYGCVSLHN